MTRKEEENKRSALHVMDGERAAHDGMKVRSRKRFKKRTKAIPVDHLTKEILSGSRLALARGITLLESTAPEAKRAGQQLLLNALPHTGKSVRIGVTGVPGAGKSTFIEQFGLMLCAQGFQVAVLAIDPSSSLSGGSILGDKTRMEKLASHPHAFIRPSPTSGTLGGVHKRTKETMLLCEATGYDIILIETVGVGQSETAVRNMVDVFLLLALTGAGDDLQGMKKGMMELVDLIIVHKADGKNLRPAKRTVREYKQILHVLQPASPGWLSTALPVSSLEKTGLTDVWETILSFKKKMKENEYWDVRRKGQTKDWFHSLIRDHLIDSFFSEPGRNEQVKQLEDKILNGRLTVSKAVEELFN